MSHSWTLADVFARRAQEHAERTMLVAGGRTLTYGQVDARAAALTAALSELGIERRRAEWPSAVLRGVRGATGEMYARVEVLVGCPRGARDERIGRRL